MADPNIVPALSMPGTETNKRRRIRKLLRENNQLKAEIADLQKQVAELKSAEQKPKPKRGPGRPPTRRNNGDG